MEFKRIDTSQAQLLISAAAENGLQIVDHFLRKLI